MINKVHCELIPGARGGDE